MTSDAPPRPSNDSFEVAFQVIDRIQGWSTRRELAALFELSRGLGGASVEIGAFCGRSTAAICLGREAGAAVGVSEHVVVDHFICSDPSAPRDIESVFRRNVRELGLRQTRLELLAMSSREASEALSGRRFELVFIDGNHDYRAVREDLTLYAPRVSPGGYLVVHDFQGPHEGVARAVRDHLAEHPGWFESEDLVDSMQIYSRRERFQRERQKL